ncbi:hypothetical protein BRC97_07895 [Halobacteriales archaeon QS_6_71_20]|nr:MAG: hypothetical protein BRC97_07895 [Halobacteriales archaeon QS_6_71_20]
MTGSGADAPVSVESVSVADFVIYPLARVHPHVHRRPGIRYVVVSLTTSRSDREARDRFGLELNGEEAPFASRQPVPWEASTTDVAFAASKDTTHDSSRLSFDGETLGALPADVIDRLNAPPVFEVGEPTVSPDEVADGATAIATVEVDVRNVGDGEAATVGLDWGSGRWSADVPVVEGVGTGEGTATGTADALGTDALPSR